MPANVSTPTPSYTRQAERWRKLEDLTSTESMVAAGTRWLPQEEAEKVNDYNRRLARSILYPALTDTIDTIVSRMFSKPVALQEAKGMHPMLEAIENDADQSGMSLTQFARQEARDGGKYGRFHFMVEFPGIVGKRTEKVERMSGSRPYFASLCPTDIIEAKFRDFPRPQNPELPTAEEIADMKRHSDWNGRKIHSRLRVREVHTEPDGEYGERQVDAVRVYIDEPSGARWELHRKTDSGEYAIVDEGILSIGFIPVVDGYFDYLAPYEANPPLEGLAWQNIKHWRSSSEQDNLLRVARVPILTAVGLSAQEITAGITLGASKLLASTNPDATFSFTEHSGAAIGAGRQDIVDIEARMEALGMAPMTSRSGAVTATAKAIDESKAGSDLEAWARVLESALKQGYEIAAKWATGTNPERVTLPEAFKVDIVTESSLSLRTPEDLNALQAARTHGDLTRATYLTELKRRGILSEMVDVEAEADAAANETPLGLVTGFGLPAPDDDDDDTGEGDTAGVSGSGAGEAA